MTRTQRHLAQFRAITRRVRTSTTIALWSLTIISAGLLIASFIVPPTGVIDPSVLRGAGMLFGFAALFVAREAFLEGMKTWPDNLPGQWYYLAIQEATTGHEWKSSQKTGEIWTKLLDA